MATIDTIHHSIQDPPVVLDQAYVDRLQGLVAAARRSAPDVAERLQSEIDRAAVVASEDLPRDVVTIGSRVAFRDDANGRVQSVILVLPQEADIARRRISVLTPIGAALIGLATGAAISWTTRDGETRQLTVLEVSPGEP